MRGATLQLSLDDALAAQREAMRRADDHADPDWQSCALDCIRLICRTQAEFSADDIYKMLDEQPVKTHERRALGPMLTRARDEGLCESTARFQLSRRASRHGAPIRVWKSRLYP